MFKSNYLTLFAIFMLLFATSGCTICSKNSSKEDFQMVRKKYETVQYELLRPQQIKTRQQACPIAYVPFGAIEWHGFHNPTGTDSLKAHAVCCEAALKYGGIVYPPQYQGIFSLSPIGPVDWGPEGNVGYTLAYNDEQALYNQAFGIVKALVTTKWKVIVLVTGHDIEVQRDALQRAIENACEGTSSAGFAVMEGELHDNPDPSKPMPQITIESWQRDQARIEKIDPEIPLMMDHAAAWETSTMLYVYPDKVDMEAFWSRPASNQDTFTTWPGTEGLLGKNPLKYGSAEMGRKIIQEMAKLIGEKALALLDETQS